MRRRTLLSAVALGLACLPATLAATPGRAEFQVIGNGRPIGSHIVEVARAGDGVTTRVAVDFAGRIGPVRFTYAHRCTENWRGETLIGLDCTDTFGRRSERVTAKREGRTLTVQGPKFAGVIDPAIPPGSWWRKDSLATGQVLDTRSGAQIALKVRRLGEEVVQAGGAAVRATRYEVRGSTHADVWYDTSGRWVKMAFRARGVSFEYRLTSPVSSAPVG
jgi:hypothetical protein